MPAGRPTLYNDSFLKLAHTYIDEFKSTPEQPIPMIVGLSKHLGVARSTIYKWADEEGKEEFSDILDQIMEEQELKLFAGGLTGLYNPTMTKLGLTKHGYSDKQELSGNPDAPLVPILNVTTSNKS